MRIPLALTLVLVTGCGRIGYDPLDPLNNSGADGGQNVGPAHCPLVDFTCPQTTFDVAGGPQSLSQECEESYSFRVTSAMSQEIVVNVTSLEDGFVPILHLVSGGCGGQQECSAGPTSVTTEEGASATIELGVGKEIIGVISGENGCGLFQLDLVSL